MEHAWLPSYMDAWPSKRRGWARGLGNSGFLLSNNLRSKRFGLGAKNEERESKTARKMAQVKERGGGGEERKETN